MMTWVQAQHKVQVQLTQSLEECLREFKKQMNLNLLESKAIQLLFKWAKEDIKI